MAAEDEVLEASGAFYAGLTSMAKGGFCRALPGRPRPGSPHLLPGCRGRLRLVRIPGVSGRCVRTARAGPWQADQ